MIAKHGEKANPGTDDRVRLEVLADWYCVQFRPRLLKCSIGFIGHSFCLIADGIESLSDVISSTVAYFGLRLFIKPPDENRPYCHGKAGPEAAIIVSLALVVAAIVIGAESIAYSNPSSLARGIHALGPVGSSWNQGIAVPPCIFRR
jgi:hypothetical protein